MHEDDALHALRYAIHHNPLDDGMVMFVGPDRAGNLLEVGVIDHHGYIRGR